MAAVATMLLLVFLVAMINVVLRANATERQRTLYLQDRIRARSLAERGITEAIGNCSRESSSGEAEETGDDYLLRTSWAPSESDATLVMIRSEINMTRGDFEPVHVMLRAGARLTTSGMRIEKWAEE
jgi:hypothetical protein